MSPSSGGRTGRPELSAAGAISLTLVALVLCGCDTGAGARREEGAASSGPTSSGQVNPSGNETSPAEPLAEGTPTESAESPDAGALDVALRCGTSIDVWLVELNRGSDATARAGLASRAASLADECPDWAPRWIEGSLAQRRRDRDAAMTAYDDALVRARRDSDREGIAYAAKSVAEVFHLHEDLASAEPLYREAVQAAALLGRQDLEMYAANGLAALLMHRGRFAEAEPVQSRVVDLLAAQDSHYLPGARYQLAILVLELGDTLAARALLERILEGGASPDIRSRAMMRLAMLEIHEGRWAAGKALFDRAREVFPQAAGRVDLHHGMLAADAGRVEEAVRVLRSAVERAPNETDRRSARQNLAMAELEAGADPASVERAILAVKREADEGGYDEQRWKSRYLLGRLYLGQEEPARAIPVLREAVTILEQEQTGLAPLELGLRFLSRKADPYVDLAVALVLERGDEAHDELFGLLGRAHARALRTTLPGAADRPAGLDALARRLRPGDVVLDYLLGTERGVLVAVHQGGTVLRVIPGLEALAEPLRRYRAALRRPLRSAEARLDPMRDLRRSLAHGERLFEALIGPVESILAGSTRLFIVPDRDLALVPLATLPVPEGSSLARPGSYLGTVLETAILPLPSAPEVWSSPAPGESRVLLAGDPLPGTVGDTAYPALPSARAELDRIGEIWRTSPTTRLEGNRLVSHELEAIGLEDFDLIHLATHAVASSQDPSRCAVILSGGDTLPLDRVVELRLSDPLVVLSACRTGEGEILPGEGVVGLAWAFLRAGAGGLVVSLWSVEDEATSRLMGYLHEELRGGRDVVAALSAARRRVARLHEHPAYWGAFEVVLRP